MFGGFQKGPFQPLPAYQQEGAPPADEVVGGAAPPMILYRRNRNVEALAVVMAFMQITNQ